MLLCSKDYVRYPKVHAVLVDYILLTIAPVNCGQSSCIKVHSIYSAAAAVTTDLKLVK